MAEGLPMTAPQRCDSLLTLFWLEDDAQKTKTELFDEIGRNGHSERARILMSLVDAKVDMISGIIAKEFKEAKI